MIKRASIVVPIKEGNVSIAQLQAEAPVEFYILHIERAKQKGYWGDAIVARRAKLFSSNGYLFVWNYAKYWSRLGLPNDLQLTSFYLDKQSALDALLMLKLQGMVTHLDEALL